MTTKPELCYRADCLLAWLSALKDKRPADRERIIHEAESRGWISANLADVLRMA